MILETRRRQRAEKRGPEGAGRAVQGESAVTNSRGFRSDFTVSRTLFDRIYGKTSNHPKPIEKVFEADATVPRGVGDLAPDTLLFAAMNKPVFEGASLPDILTMCAFVVSSINIGIATTNNFQHCPGHGLLCMVPEDVATASSGSMIKVLKWWPSSKKTSRLARMAKWPTFISIRCRVFWVFASGWRMAWVLVWVVGLGVPYNPLSWSEEMWWKCDKHLTRLVLHSQFHVNVWPLFGVVYPPPESGARFTSSWIRAHGRWNIIPFGQNRRVPADSFRVLVQTFI